MHPSCCVLRRDVYICPMSSDKKSGNKRRGMDVAHLRRSATGFALERDELHDNPIVQFEDWFSYACETVPLDPNGMSIATVDKHGRPSSRTVLLKYFDDSGFVFFSNFGSQKARDIESNPNVALLFFWSDAARQVRIQGTAEKIPTAETLKYFATRPRGSQIGAWVSAQSNVISSRSLLEAEFQKLKNKFRNKEVPLPEFWGGYRVVPQEIEFWQGRRNRLHDRFRYTLQDDGSWEIGRLAP